MATNAENIATAKANWLAWIATESANPKPTYNIDGQMVDWMGAYRIVMREIIPGLDAMLLSSQTPNEGSFVGTT